ncbi:hypothetical protein [Cupriavidus sp. YAF13]|uniref:hypothetical protein n=1 Tax=Cupriavidus sp. YAF13 TaxID=3233075 RepID=UPI003F93AED3
MKDAIFARLLVPLAVSLTPFLSHAHDDLADKRPACSEALQAETMSVRSTDGADSPSASSVINIGLADSSVTLIMPWFINTTRQAINEKKSTRDYFRDLLHGI